MSCDHLGPAQRALNRSVRVGRQDKCFDALLVERMQARLDNVLWSPFVVKADCAARLFSKNRVQFYLALEQGRAGELVPLRLDV